MDVIRGEHSDSEPECLLFGGLVTDIYYELDAWPGRGQDVMLNSETHRIGGCAVNMAVTIHNLGGSAHVVSGVGNDDIGMNMVKYMASHGMPTDLIEEVDAPSGKCFVFLEPDGERTFMTLKGADCMLSDQLLQTAVFRRPAAAGVTGYALLNDNSDRMLDALEKMHGGGTKILFDPCPLVGEIPEERLLRMLDISDIITPNSSELEVVERYMPVELAVKKGAMVVIKSGAAGGTVCYGDPKLPGIMRSLEYRAEQVIAVDTTGAGDSFAGALLYGAVHDMPLKEAVNLAVKCSGKTVTVNGPHGFWRPDEQEGQKQ